MNQFIFKNRWFAVGFVAFILLSAYLLVGDEKSGLVTGLTGNMAGEQAPDKPEGQLANAGQPAPPMLSDSDVNMENLDHMEDEELVDPASGLDPTPPEEMDQSESEEDQPLAGPDGGPGTSVEVPSEGFYFVNGRAIPRGAPQ